MSGETRNILVLNHDSKTTEFIKNIFSEACDVTLADNLAEVSEKADNGFHVIITGYLVPALSGEKPAAYLNNIKGAFDGAVSSLREKTDAHLSLLKAAKQEQSKILTFLQNHVRQAEKEKVLLRHEMQAVAEKDAVYLKEKVEAEKGRK